MAEKIEELARDDHKYLWHPFTQMAEYEKEEPVIIESAYGCYLRDVRGREYLDGVASLWTNVHGHRHPKIDRAIEEQLGKVAHSTLLGITNVPAIECARKLVSLAPPGLTKVFYSDNGSTAVEIALKMAFQYEKQAADGDPRKTKFISFKNGYHGDTIGSVSVGGIDLFHATYRELIVPSLKAEAPYCYRCPFGKTYPQCLLHCLGELEKLMAHYAHECAAVVIEPLVQGAAGIIVHPPGFLKGVRELCDKYNLFLIADEVAVGFGKTGKMFACEHEEVTPDFLALAKGITGGYLPLAATLTTEKVYRGFLGSYGEFKTFFHGHTYTGNPLACAAALANMEIFSEEKTLERLVPKIDHLRHRLREFCNFTHVGDVRQCGFMVGIELVQNKETKQPYPPEERIGHRVILEARKRGLIIRPLGDVIVLMPPLSITVDDLDKLVDITLSAIRDVTGN